METTTVDTYLETLVSNRQHAAARIREIVQNATEAKRALTPEDETALDAANADYDRLKAEEDKLVAIGEKLSAGDAVRARISPAIVSTDEADREDDRQIINVVRAAQDSVRKGDSFAARELDLAIDQGKVLRLASRAIADFSDAAHLFMNDFSTRVAVYARTASPLLAISTVIDADNGRPLVLPNLSADPASVSPGEGTAITENSGTMGEATAIPVSYKTLSYISAEAEEDELVGLLQLISRVQGRELGIKAGTAMTASLVSAASNGGTANGLGGGSTATFFGYEDLIDLKMGRAPQYRASGSWLMANGAIKKVRKFRDLNGQYLWQPAIAQGQPDLFDGQPVYEDPGLATPASVTKSVLYGDFSGWVIKQRGLRVAVSTEYRFNTDQVAIRTVLRAGGALPDVASVAYLISANT
jgi:HK97 family phage major capsid protein